MKNFDSILAFPDLTISGKGYPKSESADEASQSQTPLGFPFFLSCAVKERGVEWEGLRVKSSVESGSNNIGFLKRCFRTFFLTKKGR